MSSSISDIRLQIYILESSPTVGDRIGWKPTLLIGIACGGFTAVGFGTARSVGAAVGLRALGGMLNPNVGMVQTCAGETARGSSEVWTKAFSIVNFIRSLGNLLGLVLGGLLADPVTVYPSLFTSNSIWASYPCLLPNLAVGSLQLLTFLLTLFFLRKTHPHHSGRPDPGLSVIKALRTYFARNPTTPGSYAPLPVSANDDAPADSYPLTDLDAASPTTDTSPEPPKPSPSPTRVFIPQVVLQILALCFTAFHKVSSDAPTSTFLALGGDSPSVSPSPGFLHITKGFALTPGTISLILLTEGIFRAAIQPTLIPRFIAHQGGVLPAFRLVLAVYPLAYLFTPFLPALSPAGLGLGFMVLDLWAKVALSGVGYICSAVLHWPGSTGRQRRLVGPLVSGKLFDVGMKVGYLQIPFWTLGAVALGSAVEAVWLVDGQPQGAGSG
ncbi:protein zinc induced facilitator-LIKE 1 [Staphylotrichum tortipilum]|uniref:Protein zinc induced facilitator-LIKE 1 n=1 Tax=Staphylotrichum tortipilum TaxID=2831512 RepID=A0AAN6MCG7_9PEZI|nr:protein zinc induced facilitator-LIKE 1 [Staphylotrichum longicolle]